MVKESWSGSCGKEYAGDISATVELDEQGKTKAQIYIPYSWVPAHHIGDIVRKLQIAAEWALEQEEALKRNR